MTGPFSFVSAVRGQSVSGLHPILFRDAGLKILPGIGVFEPSEREDTKNQARQQGNHQKPDDRASFLLGHFFLGKRRHAPFGGCGIFPGELRRVRVRLELLRPRRSWRWRIAIQRLEIGSTVLTEAAAGSVSPGAVWTGIQRSISVDRIERLPAWPAKSTLPCWSCSL